ncbi:MAG: hypothetical protein ABEL51_05710, partial [Salinibacter sp.]
MMELDDILRMIGTDRSSLYTSALGVIEKYNPETERADVSLKVKRAYQGEEYEREMIEDVPVLQPGGGGGGQWKIRIPIYDRKMAEEACKEPDNCILLFLMHPLEGLLDDKKPSMPLAGDTVNHDIENAVAFPTSPFIPDGDDDKLSEHHSYKEESSEPTIKNHSLRIWNTAYHQEIVLA